jgi:hypothetical protein
VSSFKSEAGWTVSDHFSPGGFQFSISYMNVLSETGNLIRSLLGHRHFSDNAVYSKSD